MNAASASPHSWSKSAEWLTEVSNTPAATAEEASYWRAVGGIANLAAHIRDTGLGEFLFGNTSMHSLMIRQTDEPYPWRIYLLVEPLLSGKVEFRYIDTNIEKRQWRRIASPDKTVERFHRFMDQLRWKAAVSVHTPAGAQASADGEGRRRRD